MTKSEQERIAILETKVDIVIDQQKEIIDKMDIYNKTCIEVDLLKVTVKSNSDEHEHFINKKGFITASVILGVLIAAFTILQFFRG